MNNYLIEFYGSPATVDWGVENWRVETRFVLAGEGAGDNEGNRSGETANNHPAIMRIWITWTIKGTITSSIGSSRSELWAAWAGLVSDVSIVLPAPDPSLRMIVLLENKN